MAASEEPERPAKELRIGDAERTAAADELAEHYAQGRLSTEEHQERLDRVLSARTRSELGPVFADLPGSAYQVRRASTWATADAPAVGSDRRRPQAPYPASPFGRPPFGRPPFRPSYAGSARGRASYWFGALPVLLRILLVVVLVVVVLAHLPLILFGLIVFALLSRKHRRWHGYQRQ
jgi:uncharacterized membrane protein